MPERPIVTTMTAPTVRRPGRPVRFAAALVGFVALLMLCGPTPVRAASPTSRPAVRSAVSNPLTDPRPPGMFLEAWALSPSGVDPTRPGSRAFLAYSLAPGGSATDSVTLWNYSDVPLTFHVYATDAYNNRDGEFSLLQGGATPSGAGGWVTLATNYVTIDPQTKADIPLTVTVPGDALPGDHAAGIVASVPTPTTNADGSKAIVDRRTGTRVYFHVAGKVNPQLAVEAMSVSYAGSVNPLGGTATVDYTVRNLGNTRLGARQVVKVTDVVGRTVATRRTKRLQDVLPGATVTQRATIDGVPALGRVGATVALTPVAPAGATEKAPSAIVSGAHTLAIPWFLLGVVALVLLGWRLVRRFRRAS